MNDMSHTQTQTLTQRTDDKFRREKRILSVNDKQNVVCERWTERTASDVRHRPSLETDWLIKCQLDEKAATTSRGGRPFFRGGKIRKKKREKVGGS